MLKNILLKIKSFFKKLKKDFKKELNKLEEKQNESFNNKINEINEINEQLDEKNQFISSQELKKLKEKIKNRDIILKKLKLPKINKEKITLFYADDHPGALFQIYNDIRIILEKRTHLVEINNSLAKKIINLNLNFENFNIIPFKTEEAPFYIEEFLNRNIIPDIAILDIIYGGIILKNNNIITLDGLDIAKIILEKNQNALILFYTGSSLNPDTTEGKKLNNLLKHFSANIFITDKDINDQKRLEIFYTIFTKLYNKNLRDKNG